MEGEGFIIYVLQLQDDCFYIGKTKDLDRRVEEHKRGEGSAWTKLHPVVKLKETFNGDSYSEDRLVKNYMQIYGIDKVRGGSYSQIELSSETITFLIREIRGATDCCFRCGRSNHFIKNCYAKTDVNGNSLLKEDKPKEIQKLSIPEEVKPAPPNVKPLDPEEPTKCTRCGRIDHWRITCTAMEDIDGKKLEPDPVGMVGSLVKNWWFSK